MVYENLLDAVGNTRLVRVAPQIYAKMEKDNPGSSVKDRPVKEMILAAIKSGELTKGKIILEATSGNTGIALAMMGATIGYPVILTMSESVSVERRKLMTAYGAEIILTPGVEGTDGAIRKAREMMATDPEKYYYPDQFSNPNNPIAHIQTANEIWEQTEGKVTHFVATIGTGGTIMGVSKRLRELNPKIQIIEAQPTIGHKIQGLKNMQESMVPKIYDETTPTSRIYVSDDDAFQTARDLARMGHLVGMSSGAAMFAAMQIILGKNDLAVVIFPDDGMKYLSTTLFV